jgi:Leucine-rich repeat (LRR) protein
MEQLESYPNLEVLSLTCLESMRILPGSIGKLQQLKELTIDNGNGCSMNPVIPESIGNLRSLRKLTLFGAQDPRLADVQPGTRHEFPRGMSQLKSLSYLDLGRNGFDEIPPFVKDLPNLREFRFEWNKLKQVPAFIGDLKQLSTLKLAGNDLTDLPDFLNSLPRLSDVTLGNNCKITQNAKRIAELRKRFPRIHIDFEDEYDCPAE